MYLQGLDGLYSLVKSEDLQWTTSIRRILTQLQRGQNAHRRNCRAGCRLWRRRTMRWLLGSRGGRADSSRDPRSAPRVCKWKTSLQEVGSELAKMRTELKKVCNVLEA
ncbi:uncharacterized protein LOC144577399 isoform X5 [Callithrix jacchus]